MFTGIIEEIGTIRGISRGSSSFVLDIGCREVLKGSKEGDSIAVNGVCLTVTSLTGNGFTADVMPETVHRSNISLMRQGSCVNLERAMAADGRFGGHIVSGHVDGMGMIREIREDVNAVWYTVEAEPALLRYIVEKGSITIDGISLTVAYVDRTCFKVSIIPHTRKITTLGQRRVKDVVNLENDIIGKYVEKLMLPAEEEKKESRLTEEFLRSNGF
ncbi:MAG: riboflavin synthase [Lachnospiraceae bacterium]|nr:riboflavin synthase [Lachnospiraceae bacterium]MDD7023248.1 riboflavin synthase [Oscillospiraceae bacterium]MDY5540384.1 riboflavin synthase [Lachnospiraceae bacterium]MDY5647277.1 riboflavin synthase [Lachnospiraceae bacterium]